MNENQIQEENKKEPNNKLCGCGCGEYVKGKFSKFKSGHSNRLANWNNKPLILITNVCECGCGELVKTDGKRFILGHNQKINPIWLGKKLPPSAALKASTARLGKKHTLETRLKQSISGGNRLGKKHTKETLLKLSRSLKGRITKPETRFKLSVSAIKYINTHLRDGKIVRPAIGKNEIPIIDSLEKEINLIGISESKELFLRCGKWPDRYYKKYNLCIDVLESHHFKSNGELRNTDQIRELLISWKLGCMIYYIPEQEFLNNPEKEIQRFKDFLKLLDEGIN